MTNANQRDPREVELKLHIPPGVRAAIDRLPVFAGSAREDRHDVSTYFDTATHELLRKGLALRIRRSGNRLIQTLKTERAASSVADARGEWEWEVDSESPDLARLKE